MVWQVVKKLVRNLTKDEYDACHNLTFPGDQGMMKGDLEYLYQRPYTGSFVVMLRDRDTKTIASWALVNKTGRHLAEVQVYTDEAYRRQGLGRMVIQRVQKEIGNDFLCQGHDGQSAKFFTNTNCVGVDIW